MYKIGIDLGGTNIAAGILSGNELIKTISVPTNAGRAIEEIAEDMAQLCTQLMKEVGIGSVESIGIGAPGVVDSVNGIIKRAVNISPEPIEMCSMMSEYFDADIYVENDANCAAIGEAVCGAASGYKNSVTVTLGTGVGGGVIVGGKLLSGVAGGAGEIGHITIFADKPIRCKCGRVGCFEQYASASALVRIMREEMGSRDAKIDGRYIFSQAKDGNEAALAALEKYKEYLSEGLANIINIFQPEIVVVGGGISAQGDYLLDDVRKRTYEKILTKDASITKIVAAELGNNAGITGAAFCGEFR